MPSYLTQKNSLKKLESKQQGTEKRPGCGVIYQDEYEKLVFIDEPTERHGNRVGYLVVPRKLTLEEWEEKYG